jgi:hypothetical protein
MRRLYSICSKEVVSLIEIYKKEIIVETLDRGIEDFHRMNNNNGTSLEG